MDTSDRKLLALLNELKAASEPAEVKRLSSLVERLIFHKQFEKA
jgi:hypothetical protein